MKAQTISCISAALAVVQLACASATPLSHDEYISAGDLVRVASIGDPNSLDWNIGSSAVAYSPGGHSAVTVVARGNPDTGSRIGELILIETIGENRAPVHRTIATMESRSNTQPIAMVHWLDDHTIVFAGANGDDTTRVFRWSATTNSVEALVIPSSSLVWYGASRTAEVVAVLRDRRSAPLHEAATCRMTGCLVTETNLFVAETGASDSVSAATVYNTRTGAQIEVQDPRELVAGVGDCFSELAGGVSPNGHHALWLCRYGTVDALPVWWSRYQQRSTDLATCIARRNPRCAAIPILIDLRSGRASLLSEAPVIQPWNFHPVWIDEDTLVLPYVTKPLAGTPRGHANETSLWLAEVDATRNRIAYSLRLPGEPREFASVSWNDASHTLSLEIQYDGQAEEDSVLHIQRRRPANWRVVDAASEHRTPPRWEYIVRQSLEQPPTLVAINGEDSQETIVLSPNDWLRDRTLGRVEEVSWRSLDGTNWTGGIIYPPRYDSSRSYPLVIQTHGFNPSTFSLHGISRNFPGQALAARDVIVLQVRERFEPGVMQSPQEWEAARSGYEGAIEFLVSRGAIDRNRVGIIGWSRTGPQSAYLLTHSEYPIAAAAFTSTGDFDWWWYLALGGETEFGSYYGSQPQGVGFEQWLENVPTFNLERVQAPLLMWEDHNVSGLWNWYAGLRGLGKPVEYWYLADSAHELVRVDQIVETNERLTDWFDFWLNDREDSNPAKATQYTRWRELRRQQQVSAARPRPSLIDW